MDYFDRFFILFWGTYHLPSDAVNLVNLKEIIFDNITLRPRVKIFSSFTLNAFAHFLPVIAFTTYETFKLGFLNSSIAKIRFSSGYKFADIYYLFFSMIVN